MKKILSFFVLFVFLTGCQTSDPDKEPKNPVSCEEKQCLPGYVCENGECINLERSSLLLSLTGKCSPACDQTESCIDGKCIKDKVSPLCGGKTCSNDEVCDEGVCRAKKGCEIHSCTPDSKCFKGTCVRVNSCIFTGCPPDKVCEKDECK